MNKSITIALVMLALTLGGCATPIVKKPAAESVKDIAFVSVYSNIDIYDIDTKSTKGSTLAMLKKVVKGSQDITDEHVQIATYGLKSFSEDFTTKQWKVVEPSKVLKSKAYKDFRKELKEDSWLSRLTTASFATPPDMVYIPFESVAGERNKMHFGDNPTDKAKKRLADLAKELNVDAVAIAHVDLAYDRGFFSLSGTRLLNIRGSAKPSVATAVVAVNTKGQIVLQTPHIIRGGGERKEAKEKVPMITENGVNLSGDKGQVAIKGYADTIQRSVKHLRKEIKKELGES